MFARQMVDRSVVTGQASLIGCAALETRLRDVARRALLSEQRVRMRHRARVVRFWTTGQRMPSQPSKSNHCEGHRKNPPPAWDAAQLLEIIKIDALRQLLRRAGSSGHRLIPQRHHRVHAAQHQQCDG